MPLSVRKGLSVVCLLRTYIYLGNWTGEQMSMRDGLHHFICNFHNISHLWFCEKVMLRVNHFLFKPRAIWRLCEQQVKSVAKLLTCQKTVFCWQIHDAVGVHITYRMHCSIQCFALHQRVFAESNFLRWENSSKKHLSFSHLWVCFHLFLGSHRLTTITISFSSLHVLWELLRSYTASIEWAERAINLSQRCPCHWDPLDPQVQVVKVVLSFQ